MILLNDWQPHSMNPVLYENAIRSEPLVPERAP